ncbi:MAG: alkaline phosphatase family protein [Gemmatimonadales bacterium]|nr:alkaline phosphatase family protein [Gemmatimonadales bacterium]
MRCHPLLLLALALAACSQPIKPDTLAPLPDQRVILISLDGFRADFLDRGLSPNLAAIADRGVRARWMTPAFPTLTFPNHYTIVTGLHPAHHGMVANTIRDSALGVFRMSDTMANRDPRWWGGEPIWATAEKQGRRAAAFFWPGSESGAGGRAPSRWLPFDDKFPDAARVDSVLHWASQPPGTAPAITTLYYSNVDHAGHDSGPDSPDVDSAIVHVDRMVGRLVTGLRERGLTDRTNIVVVSDHGMAPRPATKLIALDDFISLSDVNVVEWSPVGMLIPAPGRDDDVYQKLRAASPHLSVYRRADVPERFHFRDSPRIPPLILVADEGWSITSRSRVASWRAQGGGHGWDNALPSMRAIFVAAGPAFRSGVVVDPFQNIHVYSLMTHIMGLNPAPNDGTLDSVRTLLRQ